MTLTSITFQKVPPIVTPETDFSPIPYYDSKPFLHKQSSFGTKIHLLKRNFHAIPAIGKKTGMNRPILWKEWHVSVNVAILFSVCAVEGKRSAPVLPADHLGRRLLSPAHGGAPRPEAGEPVARFEPARQDRRLWPEQHDDGRRVSAHELRQPQLCRTRGHLGQTLRRSRGRCLVLRRHPLRAALRHAALRRRARAHFVPQDQVWVVVDVLFKPGLFISSNWTMEPQIEFPTWPNSKKRKWRPSLSFSRVINLI